MCRTTTRTRVVRGEYRVVVSLTPNLSVMNGYPAAIAGGVYTTCVVPMSHIARPSATASVREISFGCPDPGPNQASGKLAYVEYTAGTWYRLPGGMPSGVVKVPKPSSGCGTSMSTAESTSSLHLTSYFQS